MQVYNRTITNRLLNQLYNNNFYDIGPSYVSRTRKKILNPYFLKPIAFYLPQFYPTEINDINWGKGFTEWNNVARAVPQYCGHYQPHIPECFGYYDLRNISIMKEQSELAKEYGIYGFCFYYYFFKGKTQLEYPIKNFYKNKNISFPFCLCWANENWTRKWDGKSEEILLEQTYEPQYMKMFIEKVSNYMVMDNYIRIKDRPMLIIYNAQAIINLVDTIEYWRKYCRNKGIGDIFLVCAQTFNLENHINIIKQFDACVEFPPHAIHLKNKIDYSILANTNFRGKIYHIKDYIDTIESQSSYPLFRCAFPSWDNTSRVMHNAKIFSDASPETFRIWIDKIIQYTIEEHFPEKRFFFINAWNEWGEGAHLEPDRKDGYAFLDVLRNSLNQEYK